MLREHLHLRPIDFGADLLGADLWLQRLQPHKLLLRQLQLWLLLHLQLLLLLQLWLRLCLWTLWGR